MSLNKAEVGSLIALRNLLNKGSKPWERDGSVPKDLTINKALL